MKIGYDDTLNIAYVLKNFLLLVNEVEPCGNDGVESFYFSVKNIIVMDEHDIFSVNKILREIGYSIRVGNNKLIIEKK